MTKKISKFIQHIRDIPHLWEEIEILFQKIDRVEYRLSRIEKMLSSWSEDDCK